MLGGLQIAVHALRNRARDFQTDDEFKNRMNPRAMSNSHESDLRRHWSCKEFNRLAIYELRASTACFPNEFAGANPWLASEAANAKPFSGSVDYLGAIGVFDPNAGDFSLTRTDFRIRAQRLPQ